MKNALVGIVMLVVVLWGTGWFLAGHSYVNKTTEPEVRVVTEHIQAPSNAHLIDLMNYYQTEAEKARKELWEKEKERGILAFKVAIYKEMTGKDIEVRIEQ